jgi:hypothetical protein
MEDPEYSALVDRYRNLPDEEILDLIGRGADLVPMAQAVLDKEASSRRARLEALSKTRVDDEHSDIEGQARHLEFKRKKEAKRARWYLSSIAITLAIYATFEPKGGVLLLIRLVALASIAFAVSWFVARLLNHRGGQNSRGRDA